MLPAKIMQGIGWPVAKIRFDKHPQQLMASANDYLSTNGRCV